MTITTICDTYSVSLIQRAEYSYLGDIELGYLLLSCRDVYIRPEYSHYSPQNVGG